MEDNHIRIHHWLMPLAWLYGLGVSIRNTLFDNGLLKSKEYSLPVICVGNISVGGTGKTPHTEYLIRLLSDEWQVAVLSRGYKRKSKGYRLATAESTMPELGDEPYQMSRKFPKAHVAVDADRRHGIEQLTSKATQPAVDVVILDDAFQHRYVKPGLSILLMDYHRLNYDDKLMPAGRLREPVEGIRRADMVIVTKCPADITKERQQAIACKLKLEQKQSLFFTTLKYGNLYNMQTGETVGKMSDDVLLLSGIASPRQLEEDVARMTSFTSLHFPDHHAFTKGDIAEIEARGKGKMIVTTEKDAARLQALADGAFSKATLASIYVLPVEVVFLNNEQTKFNQIITSYVRENSRNSSLPKAKDGACH